MPRVLNMRDLPDNVHLAVYVGRPTIWGNPFDAEKHGRAECLELFKKHLRHHPELIKRAKEELRGHDLMCWCAPLSCHADIWLKLANA